MKAPRVRILGLGGLAREVLGPWLGSAAGEEPFAIVLHPAEPGEPAEDPGEWAGEGEPPDAVLLSTAESPAAAARLLERVRAQFPGVPVLVAVPGTDSTRGPALLWLGTADFALVGESDREGLRRLVRQARERRGKEAELREKEEFHQRILENMGDLVAVLDPEGRRLYNSPSYRMLFGGGEPAAASDSFAEVHPADRERIRRVFRETVDSGRGRRSEYRFVMPNGTVRFLESVGSAILDESGRTSKVLVVSRDTTERREAEEALARERNLLRTLIDLLPDFIYVKNADGRFVLNNLAHARLAGIPDPARLAGRTDREIFPAELANRYEADDAAVAACGEPILNREEPVCDSAGRQLWVLTTKVPLRDPDGRVLGLVGLSRDITERRRAEEDLRQSQERLELVVRGSRDGVWDWNVVTDEVYFSPRWKSMIGYAEDEVPNTFEGWRQLVHPDDRERAMRTLADYFAGTSAEYALEHRLRHKDGSYRWILARGVALRDPTGRPLRMAGSHVDLTERRRTEERLRQAARWESVTTLAAGVAHEVKNPLQTLLLGIEYLTGRPFAADPLVGELLASMGNAARQADTIIRSLRDYAVQRQPQCQPGDPNVVIDEALTLLAYDFHRHHIDVQRRFDPELPRVCLDAEQMKQACWIVLRNAIDALISRPAPRVLTLATTTESRRPEPSGGAVSGPTAGGWVVLRVDDTGPGVRPEVLPRVFDLFFTTKQPGRGTGIGLPLARRILESHGGTIDLANRPEGGARVTIAIPVPAQPLDCGTCESSASPSTARARPGQAPPGGHSALPSPTTP
jgi:PAS domain S-box-containing protein